MSINDHWDKFKEESLSKAHPTAVDAFEMAFFLGSASTFVELGKITNKGLTSDEGGAAVKKLRNEVIEIVNIIGEFEDAL